MSHETTSYKAEKPRLSMMDRAKKTGVAALALVSGGAMLGGLSGCGEKAGAIEKPTTPAASAPKTPEASATPTPEKEVELPFEVKAYEQRLAPANLKGKTEEEMTAMFADGIPGPEDPKLGLYIYGGIDALYQACADAELVPPLDTDGVVRNTEDLEADCRPYYKAAMNGIFGVDGPTKDHIGTLANRMVYRKASQQVGIDAGVLPRKNYQYNTKLRSASTDADGTIRLSIDGYDFDGPSTVWAKQYTKKLMGMIGGREASRGAIKLDHLDIAWNPKTGTYNDMARCVSDSTGSKDAKGNPTCSEWDAQ